MFGPKKHFKFNDIVQIKNTGSPIDGEQGRITGTSSINIQDTYIVTFDEPKTGWNKELNKEEMYQSVTVPEYCLDYPVKIQIKTLLKING
jgi:hypothetical protein